MFAAQAKAWQFLRNRPGRLFQPSGLLIIQVLRQFAEDPAVIGVEPVQFGVGEQGWVSEAQVYMGARVRFPMWMPFSSI